MLIFNLSKCFPKISLLIDFQNHATKETWSESWSEDLGLPGGRFNCFLEPLSARFSAWMLWGPLSPQLWATNTARQLQRQELQNPTYQTSLHGTDKK